MAQRIVAGIFASIGAGEQAQERLLAAGVARDCIALSRDLTADGIAAEAPGQPYCNQPGQGPESDPEKYSEAALGGGCVIQVNVASGRDQARAEHILRDCGARRTTLL